MIVYALMFEVPYECDEVVGIYSTRENAEQAMADARDPGKVARPATGGDRLVIVEWRVDAGPWEG